MVVVVVRRATNGLFSTVPKPRPLLTDPVLPLSAEDDDLRSVRPRRTVRVITSVVRWRSH